MADQEMQDEENTVSDEVRAEAKALGWADRDAWKGKPEDWVDADAFLDKAKHVLPILKSNNQRLQGELNAANQQLAKVLSDMKGLQVTVKMLEESRDEDVKEQVAAERERIKKELAAASRDGEHERVAELTEELTELSTAEREQAAAKKAAEKAGEGKQEEFQLSPELKQWFVDNPLYVTDMRRRALGDAVAAELRQAGDKTTGAAFMDKIRDEVEKTLGGKRPQKALGGNGGGGRQESHRDADGKGYADLPQDAKEVCNKQAARFVGENRRYKTLADWQKSYAKQYFAQE